MFILAGIIADPAPSPSHDERSSKEQLRDSSQWQQRKGPSYIFITTSRDPQKKHKQQNIIAQCTILATRSVWFRVQFHLKCEGRWQEWVQQGLGWPGCSPHAWVQMEPEEWAQLKSFLMLGHQLVCSSSAQGAYRLLLISGILSQGPHGAWVRDSFCHR